MEEHPLDEAPQRGAWTATKRAFHSFWAWAAEIAMTALGPLLIGALCPPTIDPAIKNLLQVAAGVFGALLVPISIYAVHRYRFWRNQSKRLAGIVREYRARPEVQHAKRLSAFEVALLGKVITGAEYLRTFADGCILGGLRWEGMARRMMELAGCNHEPEAVGKAIQDEVTAAWLKMSQELHAVNAIRLEGTDAHEIGSWFVISDHGWEIVNILRRREPL